MEELIICDYCGETLDECELENPFKDVDDNILCDLCYEINYRNTCVICEESYDKPTKPEELFFVIATEVKDDVLMHPIIPGIYQTTSWPYFLAATGFGFEMLYESSIKLVRALDINSILKKLYSSHEYIGGDEICSECADKYGNVKYKKRVNYCDKNYKLHYSVYERGIINNGR